MKLIERLGLAALHKFDPETSHGLSIAALKSGFAPLSSQVTTPR
ncbi:MAG: dihydroorotate dehydrogenase (quinone), partial [Rhodobacteraceae bacterium]|nr:dihydroorotate dehydrogenase (quinone) [Paracoccaceae bacterium]